MTINVYWASIEDEWLRAKEPESVYKRFIRSNKMSDTDITLCPANRDYMKKFYTLQSLYTYDFEIIDNGIKSNLYDEKFLNNHVTIRSLPNKIFSFYQKYIFFTDEDSLTMSAGITPIFENNYVANNCVGIPGTIDIGKWFRSIEYAFYLKDNVNSFSIKEGDVYNYIHFDTNEKIKFNQFITTPQIVHYLHGVVSAKNYRFNKKINELEDYYKMMKFKKSLIKEIKNNLI